MKLNELIERLTEMREELEAAGWTEAQVQSVEVSVSTQPGYPHENDIAHARFLKRDAGDTVVTLAEGSYQGYGQRSAWDEPVDYSTFLEEQEEEQEEED